MNSTGNEFRAQGLTPILYAHDFAATVRYYTEKLLFKKLWEWGDPPGFGAVALGKAEIFLCQGEQGHPGTWLAVFIEDVDAYFTRISELGADIVEPPANMPWGMREMQVRDPNQHIIRFGHGIPARLPKMEVERVPVEARLEKRLAAVLEDLARHKGMTVGETLEETLLHTFERLDSGGVASPHTEGTLDLIKALKRKHGIDYDCHAIYRFEEKSPDRVGGKTG